MRCKKVDDFKDDRSLLTESGDYDVSMDLEEVFNRRTRVENSHESLGFGGGAHATTLFSGVTFPASCSSIWEQG